MVQEERMALRPRVPGQAYRACCSDGGTQRRTGSDAACFPAPLWRYWVLGHLCELADRRPWLGFCRLLVATLRDTARSRR